MLLTEYPEANGLSPEAILIIDGPNGTQKISVTQFAEWLPTFLTAQQFADFIDLSKTVQTRDFKSGNRILLGTEDGTRSFALDRDGYYALLDDIIVIDDRRNTWRGINLGDHVTSEIYHNIWDRTFKGLFIGDFWEIDGRRYRIMDMNYFNWIGNNWANENAITRPHLVLVPDTNIYEGMPMNSQPSCGGGYVKSIYNEHGGSYPNYSTKIRDEILWPTFGEHHILRFGEILSNAASLGQIVGCAWYGCWVQLMSELQVLGTRNMSAMNAKAENVQAVVSTNMSAIASTQFAGFRLNPTFRMAQNEENQRSSYWLRDIVSDRSYAAINWSGVSFALSANTSGQCGFRPFFCIGSENESYLDS